MLDLNIRIDASGLNKGIEASKAYTKRTMPELVNTSAYWVAVNTKNHMDFVTPERVDTELGTVYNLTIGKRGKPLSPKYARNLRLSGGKTVSMGGKEVPLTALIISARAKPDSKYNISTNQRYRLPRNPFSGVSRAAGRAAMAVLTSSMIKARHSSGKFLLSGWIPVIRKLLPLSAQKFIKGGARPLEDARAWHGADLGEAVPATSGYSCTATIADLVGMAGQNADNFNRALFQHGAPVLQAALDFEGQQQMKYALNKMEEEMADGIKPHWS